MEDSADAAVAERIEYAVAQSGSGQNYMEEVMIADAVFRYDRKREESPGFEWLKGAVIVLIDLFATIEDSIDFFQLCVEKCAADFAGDVRGAKIDPRVFVDFTAEESLSVRSLVTKDLGTFDKFRVIDAQSTAFPAGDVFGFVKAVAAEVTDGAQGTAVVPGINTLSSIFHDADAIRFGDGHDPIHLATDAGVMHHANRACFGGDGVLDECFVDVEGVGANIDEDRPGAQPHESGRCGNEGPGWHDHFVAGADIAELCGNFKGCSAGWREQDFGDGETLLQELGAALGEIAVSTQITRGHGLGDVVELFTRNKWFVEGDTHSAASRCQEAMNGMWGS